MEHDIYATWGPVPKKNSALYRIKIKYKSGNVFRMSKEVKTKCFNVPNLNILEK